MKKKTQRKAKPSRPPVSNFEIFLKSVLSKAVRISPKNVTIIKSDKPNNWKAVLLIKNHVNESLLKSLYRVFKRNTLNLISGSLDTSFSSHKDTKSSLRLEFKRVTAYKKLAPKRNKIKANAEDIEMNNVQILANSINYGLKLNRMSKEVNSLIVADDSSMEGLKVLRHGEGARLGMQMFQEYVSEKDYSSFLPFMRG